MDPDLEQGGGGGGGGGLLALLAFLSSFVSLLPQIRVRVLAGIGLCNDPV